MSLPITHLDVARLPNDLVRYTLTQPGQTAPIVLVLDGKINRTALAALSSEVTRTIEEARLADKSQAANMDDFIKRASQGLYRCLFHGEADRDLRDLRDVLRGGKTSLQISTDEPDIFWELLHDGSECFGLKFDMGRRLKARLLPAQVARPQRKWRALVIADPNGDDPKWRLPAAAVEGARLRDWLGSRNVNCDDYLEGTDATYVAVLNKLAGTEYDIIHYAGHVVRDQQHSTYAFHLNGGALFDAPLVREQLQGSPIVFLNGCWSGRANSLGDSTVDSGESTGPATEREKVETLTDAFLRAGAQIVVGSLFAPTDEGAFGFAERFYDNILDGRPAGEAMRLARKYVMGRTGCAASWACFIMYGDPSLAPFQDDLQAGLRSIGLSRTDFDARSYKALELARVAAGRSRLLGSAELLYSMLELPNSQFADHVTKYGVSAQRMQAELRNVFCGGVVDRHGGLELSEHVRAVLGAAREASAGRNALISEMDLVRGVARGVGGRAKAVLGRQIAPQMLDPDISVGVAPAAVALCERVGPLVSADCDAHSWRVLVAAAGAALRAGGEGISTKDFFLALRQNPHGAMARALTRFGVRPIPVLDSPRNFAASFVPCTDNLANILQQAKAIAAARSAIISERDFIEGFVWHSDGSFAQGLRREGIILEALTSDIFDDSGGLRLGQAFDEAASDVMRAAIAVAVIKGRDQWSRADFLYGLLTAAGAALPGLLRSSGFNVENLSAIWYTRLDTGMKVRGGIGNRACDMDPAMLRLLCLADADAGVRTGQRIRELHLLRAFQSDGGGSAGEFLIREGVQLGVLLQKLD